MEQREGRGGRPDAVGRLTASSLAAAATSNSRAGATSGPSTTPLMPPANDPSGQPRGPYRALGVEQDATEAQIKRAYHKLALRYHPVRAQEHTRAR